MPGFSGQGRVLIGTAQLVGGIRQPGLLRWIGNASKFEVAIEEQTAQRSESFSGTRSPLRRITKSRGAKLDVVFDEFNSENLALALGATVTQVSTGTAVTNYNFPTGARVGTTLALPAKNVTAVTVTDSAAGNLVLGTHYTLDAANGAIELLSLGSFVQPFRANFTPGAHTKVGALNVPTTEVFVQLQGINTDDNSRVSVDVFRVKLTPAKMMSLINDDFADFNLDGEVLADTARSLASADGQLFAVALL
jgi:hypothetical protein